MFMVTSFRGFCRSWTSLRKWQGLVDLNFTQHMITLRAVGIESGERSCVGPPVPRYCTGKLTHAARRLSHSRPRGVYLLRSRKWRWRSCAICRPASANRRHILRWKWSGILWHHNFVCPTTAEGHQNNQQRKYSKHRRSSNDRSTQNSPITWPSAIAASLSNVFASIFFETALTEPSANANCTTPVWKLSNWYQF